MIDLIEILKNVPQGTELRCLMFKDPVTLYSVIPSAPYPISVKTSVGERIFLSKEGYYSSSTASQNCVLYPPMMNSWDNVEYIPDGKLVVYEKNDKIFNIGYTKGGWVCKNTSKINVYWWYALQSHTLYGSSIFYFDRQVTGLEETRVYNLLKNEGYRVSGTELKQVYEFKKGDIVVDPIGIIAIYDHANSNNAVVYKAIRRINGEIVVKTDTGIGYAHEARLATKEEKNLFFNSLAEAGYFWNSKEIVPMFKKGDIVISSRGCITIVDHVGEFGSYNDVIYYQCCINSHGKFKIGVAVGVGRVCDCTYASIFDQERILRELKEHGFELKGDTIVKKRFDPQTFEPFQKVLVRSIPSGNWRCTFFSHMTNGKAICSSDNWSYCIPYKNNEHLRGTSDDCDDFYKWWGK